MTTSLKTFINTPEFDDFFQEFKRRLFQEKTDLPDIEKERPEMKALIWVARQDGLKMAEEIIKRMIIESQSYDRLEEALKIGSSNSPISEIKYVKR